MYFKYKPKQVVITKIKGGVSEEKFGVCFHFLSEYFTRDADELIYKFVPNRDILSGNEIKGFLKFINDIFAEKVIDVVGNPANKSLKVSVKRSDFTEIAFKNSNKMMLIFTFARYLEEFPEIVKRFMNKISGNLETDFDAFLDLQVSNAGDISHNLSGHGFAKGYYAKTKRTLAEFREAFKSDRIYGCSKHVYKD